MKGVILCFVLLYSISSAQSWNNIVTTTINESTIEKMELFTNRDGNHLILKRSNGNIVYYNFNSSGTVNTSKTITLTTSGEFPNIIGSANRVYAVYKSGNSIKGKYSTNGGSTWTNIPDKSINPYPSNGVDAAYDIDRGLHLVYSTQDNSPDYETHYWRLNTYDQWTDYKNVTDYTNEVGGFPSVSFSAARVHVSYNSGTQSYPPYNEGISKSRDRYNPTSQWQNPQSYFSQGSSIEKIFARGDSLFSFYYTTEGSNPIYNNLYVTKRGISGSTWSAGLLLETFADSDNLISVTKTSDNKIHIIYPGSSVYYRNYNGQTWSSETGISTGSGFTSPQLSSVSNDLFVVYKESGSSYIKYRQFDAIPLAPTGLAVSVFDTDINAHPKLDWSKNLEPDVAIASSGYLIYRSINGGAYTNIAAVNGNTTSYIDYDIDYAGSGRHTATYKIRAGDVNNNLSPYSGTVSIDYGDAWKISIDIKNETPFTFNICQNYPNPFNPSTKIQYSLSEESLVSIKVYSLLGAEVAELVNDTKQEGIYEAEFDAADISGGVYFYRILVYRGDNILFNKTMQMIVLK